MIGSVLVCAFGRPRLSANGTPSRPTTSIGTFRAMPEPSMSARCRRTYVSAAELTRRQSSSRPATTLTSGKLPAGLPASRIEIPLTLRKVSCSRSAGAEH